MNERLLHNVRGELVASHIHHVAFKPGDDKVSILGGAAGDDVLNHVVLSYNLSCCLREWQRNIKLTPY